MDSKELQAVFSRNIKDARSRLGLSQLKFAEKADLSVGYVCDLESGRRWGTPETFAKLAAALGVEPFLLLMDISRTDDGGNALRKKIAASAELDGILRRNLSEAADVAVAKSLSEFSRRNEGGEER